MFRSRIYRHDNEQLILVLSILLVLVVTILISSVTFCVSGIFILGMFVVSALMIHSHHRSLMQHTLIIDERTAPDLADVVNECANKLQPGEVDVFLAKQDQLNAYTFGLSRPKALVLYTPLLKVMSAGELKFIIGHEMGHVALGHTWLNTILGGLAGIPAPFGASIVLYAVFRWWNRMCEFSADRAGLLACEDKNLAISALVKLVAPEVRNQRDFENALAVIDAEDDEVSNRVAELFQSHPMLIRRINELREYNRTKEYVRLQEGVNSNVGMHSVGEVHQASTTAPSPSQPKPVDKQPPPKSAEERWPWLNTD
ncbi:MAG: M48 family metallopeptidase [Chloroflexota bacterium]|nr:M48 family metallopeptidase [Chloroflexota bacterium]